MGAGIAIAGIASALIGAGASVYSSQQQKKAASGLAGSAGNLKTFEPALLKDTKTIDPRQLQLNAIDIPFDRLAYARRYTEALNAMDYKEATRYLRKIQPSFDAIQQQVGQNALSYARGEIPQDVSAEIGRKAAERGIQAGYGFGSQGGARGALANLNLRNLGLTSLDLSRFGTQMGMQVNAAGKALLPNLRSPADFLLTTPQIAGIEQFNIGTLNDASRYNNQLINQARMQNTSLANAGTQAQAQAQYQSGMTDAATTQAIGQALSQVVGSLGGSGLFGGQGGAGGAMSGYAAGGGLNSAPRGTTAPISLNMSAGGLA